MNKTTKRTSSKPTTAKPPKTASSRAASERPRRRSGTSGLDAAAAVLASAGQPMRCADLVQKMLAKGMWKTTGKTPAATIHAAIIREIRDKGNASRFRKVGRGMFALGKQR